MVVGQLMGGEELTCKFCTLFYIKGQMKGHGLYETSNSWVKAEDML